MDKRSISKNISKNIVLIQFIFSFIIVAVVSFFASYFTTLSMRNMEDNVRQRIIAVSKILSRYVYPDELDKYQTVEDMELSEYKLLGYRLQDFVQENDVTNAYFIRVKNNRLQYIIHNNFNSKNPSGLNTPSHELRERNPWITEALQEQGDISGFQARSFGSEGRITAFSPVFDYDNNVAALAGVDIDDSSIAQTRRTASILTIVQVIMVILIFVSGFLSMVRLRHEAEKANAANLAKSNFLSRMSHEIRTPLNAIIGMGELALFSESMPKILEYIKGIKQAGHNLLSLINDILDFSKIETGSLQIIQAPYSLASILNDVINVIQIRLTDKNIIFTVNVDPYLPARLLGDEIRIRQIFFNLLSNAAKYTHEGLISLRVAAGVRQEEKDIPPLTITVTDTGIGIKSEDMDHLFSDFTRFDMVKNKNIEGSGLGLAITRSLCRAMGGDITVSSEYGKGSVFVATILQSAADGEKLAVVDNPRVKIILLYDHRKEYVKSLTETLRGLGVIVVIADDEDDFKVKLSSGGFSFVFVSEVVLEQARMIIKEKSIHTVLVLLSDIGKVAASENVMVIPMPAYAVSVANVINGKTGSLKENKNAGAGFIAPDARLLVVDDIPANLVVAEGLLSPYKARIDTCSSGARSLDLIKMHRYDLVFMDHMMPEMDGIETVRIVRQWEKEHKSPAVPIVALTANAISGMREMFLEEGFNDYLSKPIDTFRLNEIMKAWILHEKQKPKEIEDHVEEPDIVKDSVIKGIDLKQGQERYPGKAYLEVIRAWCMYTPTLLEKLRELTAQPLTEKTIGEYTIAVHGLKGSTYGICAESTAKKAADLEAASRRKDTEFITANTGFLIEEASALLRELEKFLAGVTQQAESKPLRECPDADLLSRLFKAGEQYRSIQMEEILCELESFQYESGGDLIQWLREQMNELEYDAINERLKKELSAIKTADNTPTGDI